MSKSDLKAPATLPGQSFSRLVHDELDLTAPSIWLDADYRQALADYAGDVGVSRMWLEGNFDIGLSPAIGTVTGRMSAGNPPEMQGVGRSPRPAPKPDMVMADYSMLELKTFELMGGGRNFGKAAEAVEILALSYSDLGAALSTAVATGNDVQQTFRDYLHGEEHMLKPAHRIKHYKGYQAPSTKPRKRSKDARKARRTTRKAF